jgi:ATPase family protein associated with various cellular activities (AAA)
MTGENGPELADVGRLARKLVGRAVRLARQEEQPLRRRLLEHLGPDAAFMPTISNTCPLYEHVNLQVGVDAWLAAPGRTHEVVGITGIGMLRHTDVTIGDLMESSSYYGSAGVGAPITTNLPSGPDGQTRACVSNGVYLVTDGDERLVIMFLPSGTGPHAEVQLQITGPDQDTVERVMREIWRLAAEHSVFRGQVISFGPEMFGPGGDTTPLSFLRRPTVSRDQIVLPEALLDEIERQVIGVAKQASRLLASGQHLKRGILLHGAPGTGKTHTVSYLLGRLPDVTVIVISGRALDRIREACSVARTLQPAAVVVEDVDLIAEERTARDGEHPLLFQLLNEMEGLNSASDVTFLLTTNRADLLEPALAERPGRVDLAAELPLPDDDARRALIRLYQGGLVLDGVDLDAVIARTGGVTAPFLKELLRKAALLAADGDGQDGADGEVIRVRDEHITTALDQLLTVRSQLTRVLLGGQAKVPAASAS